MKNGNCVMKVVFVSICLLMITAVNVYANRASVTIDVPQDVVQGTKIKIKLNIMHNGNNFMHYVNWVVLKADGKEIARWDFSAFNLPEQETFSKEVYYTITKPVEFSAEARSSPPSRSLFQPMQSWRHTHGTAFAFRYSLRSKGHSGCRP